MQKKPIMIVGNGCIRENASEHVRKFVQKTQICSMNTFMGKGVIPDDWDTHLHTIGIKDADHALKAILDADVVISVGYDLVEYSPKMWNSKLDKKIIHVDFTPAEVYTYYRPDVEIVSDVEYAIDQILNEMEQQCCVNTALIPYPRKEIPSEFQKIRDEVLDRISAFEDDSSYPAKPEKIITDIRKVLERSDILISDVGTHKLWIAKVYNTFEPNTCIIPNGFASMGFALPGAISAKMAFPEKTIVAISGDGGFLMNMQEIETAVRLKIPIIVVVWIDDEFNLIKIKQTQEFGHSVGTEFGNPNIVKLAESFGAIGKFAKSTDEFIQFLNEAKSEKTKPTIIGINVDYSRNSVLLDDNFAPYVKSLEKTHHKN